MNNHLKDTPVVLKVGMRVAQIPFYQVDFLSEKETYARTGGQYQNTDDERKMIEEWSPCSMLPKFDPNNP